MVLTACLVAVAQFGSRELKVTFIAAPFRIWQMPSIQSTEILSEYKTSRGKVVALETMGDDLEDRVILQIFQLLGFFVLCGRGALIPRHVVGVWKTTLRKKRSDLERGDSAIILEEEWSHGTTYTRIGV